MNLLEQFAGAIVLTDLKGTVTYWSPAAEQRFGWRSDDTLDRPLHELLAPSAALTLLVELPRQLPSQEIRSECRVVCKDGSTIDLSLHTLPMVDESRQPYGFVQVLRDLRFGKAEERQALDQANSRTIPVQRKLIHDFNNLLTSIHACLELTLQEELPVRVVQFLTSAQTSSLRAAQLASAFRATAREQDARTSAPAPAPAAQPTHETPGARPLDGKERILIAEDDNGTRLLMKAILAYRGYIITDVGDGQEAWARCEAATTPFDLAILDINMPRMGGREVFEKLRKRWKDVPVLFLSGDSDEFPALPSEQSPRTSFLAKPFGNQDLLRAVRGALDQQPRDSAAGNS